MGEQHRLPLHLTKITDAFRTYRVPISEVSSYGWVKNHDVFLSQSPNGAEMLITDPATGKTHSPRPGEIFKNPTLAKVSLLELCQTSD